MLFYGVNLKSIRVKYSLVVLGGGGGLIGLPFLAVILREPFSSFKSGAFISGLLA